MADNGNGGMSKVNPSLLPIGTGGTDLRTLNEWLGKASEQLEQVASRYITVDRLIKVALLAVSRQPLLFECTRESFLLSLMEAAQIGLEPTGFQGEAYLIPRRNNDLQNRLRNLTGQRDLVVREANFQPGYRGLIKVMLRDPIIARVEARAVYPGDHFEFSYGLNQDLDHVPVPPSKRESSELDAVYAVTRFRDKVDDHFEIMWREDVEHVRQSSESPSGKYSPWSNHYEMMARKSVLRREAKLVPTTDTEAITLAEYDEQVEMGRRVSLGALNPAYRNLLPEAATGLYADDVAGPKETRTDQVREAIRVRTPAGREVGQRQAEPEPAGETRTSPENAGEGREEPADDGAELLQLKGEYRRKMNAALPSPVPDQVIREWEVHHTGAAFTDMDRGALKRAIAEIDKGNLPGGMKPKANTSADAAPDPDAGLFPQSGGDATEEAE